MQLRREMVKKIVFLRYAIETFTECFFTFDKLRHREGFAVTKPVEVRTNYKLPTPNLLKISEL